MSSVPKTSPVLTPVKDSSNISGLAYDPLEKWLYVQYLPARDEKEGALYRYRNVPPGTWKRVQSAPSKGAILWTLIRDKYRYQKWTGHSWKGDTSLKREQAEARKLKAQDE